MDKCISTSMLGQVAYTLRDIECNRGIGINKLRLDIKNGILISSGKINNSYYVIQSELDKYLKVIRKQVEVSEKQEKEMQHALGLNYKKKPYRNRFYCDSDDKNWNDLVSKGLAVKGNGFEDGRCYFWLSKIGVAYILGKSISHEEYKEL